MSVYILRRHERRGVGLFVGVTTGMEVELLGGHMIVGVKNIGIAPPGLATRSRIEMVAGGHAHMHVCDRSLGMSSSSTAVAAVMRVL